MSRFCSQCGSEVFGGGRFCRACGTPVAAGTGADDAEATAPADGGPLGGDRPLAGGSRVAAPPAAPWDDPTVPVSGDPAPAPRAGGGNGPFLAIIALVAIVMLAGGGVGAYLLLGDDAPADETDWADAWSKTDDRYSDDGSSGDDDAAGGQTTTEGDDADDGARSTTSNAGAGPLAATLEPGLYVQLGSFLSDGATREVERLRDRGIDAFAADSDGIAELLPSFRVILAGPLASAREQRRVLRAGGGADVAGIAKTLTPVTTATSASAVAGVPFAGELRGPEAEVDVTIEFDDSGRSASIDYAGRRCDGELSLIDTAGAIMTYDHRRVGAGDCPPGGNFAVKPIDGELRVTWRHSTTYDFMGGTLAADGPS